MQFCLRLATLLLICSISWKAYPHGLSPPTINSWVVDGVTIGEFSAANYYESSTEYRLTAVTDEGVELSVFPKTLVLGPYLSRNITVFGEGLSQEKETTIYVCSTTTNKSESGSVLNTRICSQLRAMPKYKLTSTE